MPILDNFGSQFINNVSELEYGLMSSHDKTKLDGISLDDIKYINEGLKEIEEYMVDPYIYGIKIDPSISDSDNCVVYTDNAVGFVPLKVDQSTGICNYGSWKNIIETNLGIYPCLVKTDGTVISKLDPNNYNKTIDGNSIDIESGSLGQVMIRFKKIYYKFSMDGDKIWFRISNKRIDHTWIDTAFTIEDGIGSVKNEMFVAAYESTLKNNTLQSISNTLPSFKLYFDQIEESSQFGVFNMMNIVRKQFITFLGYLVTKSINLEGNIGMGNISGDIIKTGTMNTKGLFYGKNNNIEGVKLFGIENLWGNQLKYMHGIVQKLVYVLNNETNMTDPEQHLYIKEFSPYDKIEDYSDIGKIEGDSKGYISSIKFIANSIYIPDKLSGSTNSYYKSYFQNGISQNSTDRLYGIYGGNNKYTDKCGSEFLLLANLDPDIMEATTHIIY